MVITWVGFGNPAKLRFWERVRGDDRGGGSVLSVVVCEAGGAELELGDPRVGRPRNGADAELLGRDSRYEIESSTPVSRLMNNGMSVSAR